MKSIGIWHIQAGKPQRLQRSQLSIERDLEDWIEQAPELVNPDLVIVGRQMHVDSGFLDLLAVDQLGNYWAVIEIKRGKVHRETVAQTVDYAACIMEMPPDELKSKVKRYLSKHDRKLQHFLRDLGLDETIFAQEARQGVAIYVIGTGRDANLERIANFFAAGGNQLSVVTFDVFEDAAGNPTLVRQLDDLETAQPATAKPPDTGPKEQVTTPDEKIAKLLQDAEQNSVGEAFQIIYEAATKHGLHPAPYTIGMRYAPPADKRRYLIYSRTVPQNGKLDFYVSPQAFAEFFPVSERQARRILGRSGRAQFTPQDAREFAKVLDRLFEIINADS